MQGVICLKGCGASIDDIKEYCQLCKLPESQENLQKRYQIILRQRKRAYQRLADAQATVDYMDHKVQHYEQILAGDIPDDSNPDDWTKDTRPAMHLKSKFFQMDKKSPALTTINIVSTGDYLLFADLITRYDEGTFRHLPLFFETC